MGNAFLWQCKQEFLLNAASKQYLTVTRLGKREGKSASQHNLTFNELVQVQFVKFDLITYCGGGADSNTLLLFLQ